MNGTFNPNFNSMNNQQINNMNNMNMNNGFGHQQQQKNNNNSGWVGFGGNNGVQNGTNSDFMSGQNGGNKDSKSSILGKYHAKPSQQFMTSLPGQNNMNMNNQMMGRGMNQMNNMGNNMNMNMNNMNN